MNGAPRGELARLAGDTSRSVNGSGALGGTKAFHGVSALDGEYGPWKSVLEGLEIRVTERTLRVLEAIAQLSESHAPSNREVAGAAGIADQGQACKLLKRLQGLGVIENTGPGPPSGEPNAWRLTAVAEELESAIRHEATAASVAFDLPEAFRGLLDHRAVAVLRVIGDQPWLTRSEVALRAGIEDPRQISKVLTHLAGLGLVASVRDAQREGTPNAWRLTAAGEELDRTIGREAPRPPRSRALDLMWESGGRLSRRAVLVLLLIAAEAGLSNHEIALRLGISNENIVCKVLAGLLGRGLIENTRNGGRVNVWQLSADGERLERAIRDETLAAGW